MVTSDHKPSCAQSYPELWPALGVDTPACDCHDHVDPAPADYAMLLVLVGLVVLGAIVAWMVA